MRNKLGKDKPNYESNKDWEKFNNLPELDKKLYVRIIIDLLKTIHNILIILNAEKEKA